MANGDKEVSTVNTFFDSRSTCSLISAQYAKGLIGKPVNMLNGTQERKTKLYMVELLSCKKIIKHERAFGISIKIGSIPDVDLSPIKMHLANTYKTFGMK